MNRVEPATPRRESFMDRLGAGVGAGLQGLGQIRQQHEEDEALERLTGQNLRGLSPEFKKMGYEASLKQKGEAQKLKGQEKFDQKRYDVIKERFGEEEADLYMASTKGGQTKQEERLLEKEERFPEDIEEGEEKPEDYGLTYKEKVGRENERYAKGIEPYQASQQKIMAADIIGDELEILDNLSPQIDEWERLNTDPRTGELFIPFLSSPEAQQFVKTVNNFTTQAKDSYGSRVTNFDLQQFMRRLPTLANSKEGRRRIIAQMKHINDLNKMYEQGLQDTIENAGGLRKIDYDKALRVNYKNFKKAAAPIKAEMIGLSNAQNKEFDRMAQEYKDKLVKGEVLMLSPDGEFMGIQENEVKKAQAAGYTFK